MVDTIFVQTQCSPMHWLLELGREGTEKNEITIFQPKKIERPKNKIRHQTKSSSFLDISK